MFEPITDPTMIRDGPKTTHVTVVRSGVWKHSPHGGGMGKAGKRKAKGYKKGFGFGGSRPTPQKSMSAKAFKKEEK